VMDVPLWWHWRKLLVWLVFNANLVTLTVLMEQRMEVALDTEEGEPPNPPAPSVGCEYSPFVCMYPGE